jgi:hypothetical protein
MLQSMLHAMELELKQRQSLLPAAECGAEGWVAAAGLDHIVKEGFLGMAEHGHGVRQAAFDLLIVGSAHRQACRACPLAADACGTSSGVSLANLLG